jgi:hypothetical protein
MSKRGDRHIGNFEWEVPGYYGKPDMGLIHPPPELANCKKY